MRVISVNAGTPTLETLGEHQLVTAINKRPLSGRVTVTKTGLLPDHQAHRDVHGGEQLALCVFAHEHYPFFSRLLGVELPLPSFGENLTTQGMLENEACIGDIYKIGEVTVQISQPREPCSTLTRKHRRPELAQWINDHGFTGFYLRVLQSPGTIGAGDEIQLVNRPHEGLTVAQAMRAMFEDPVPRELVEKFAACEGLSPKWRKRMAKRI